MDSRTSAALAREIAASTLDDKLDILVACRELALLRSDLPILGDEIMDTFIGVASEVDDLPLGSERSNWDEDALASIDRQADEYRLKVREVIRKRLLALLETLDQKTQCSGQLLPDSFLDEL